MTQRPNGQGDGADPAAAAPAASAAALWQDWITIWQSELNALATDREAQQAWAKLVALWASSARAAGRFLPDGPPGHSGAEPSAGPSPADAAPDARELALERLARRVEELERRLAGLAGGDSKPGGRDGEDMGVADP